MRRVPHNVVVPAPGRSPSARRNAPWAGARVPRAARRAILVASLAIATSVSVGADAQSSLLHEFVPPDPAEDVTFAATTLDGDLPAAIETPSGIATAPDPQRPPDAQHVYGGDTVDDGPDSSYEPDRDTRRPEVESYEDPFSPATAPFKRLRAYDAVEVDYTLRVRDRRLIALPVGGSARPADEPFYADFSVDLAAGEPVRIPTVGPGARVLRMHANPAVPVALAHDGADNWFARGAQSARVRLVMELAIPRATFGSEIANVDWRALDPATYPQPAAHRAAFEEVARAIGISRAMRPRDVVTRMVEYFRSFQESNEPPTERGDIYLDLALSKKGVCRHRSFAFLVTALNIGIPARMVVNEAHAWVEVWDSKLWHRIDLGGAASELAHEIDPTRPAYVPPPDPYAWPRQRDSGQELADRARAATSARASNAPAPSPSTSDPAAPPGPASAQAPPSPPSPTSPSNPEQAPATPAEVSVRAVDRDVRRGLPLHLQGEVKSGGSPCAHVRVDVQLRGGGLSAGVVLGSLSTDARGVYDGAVVVPRDLAVGDYQLVVVTPGDARCGAGESR